MRSAEFDDQDGDRDGGTLGVLLATIDYYYTKILSLSFIGHACAVIALLLTPVPPADHEDDLRRIGIIFDIELPKACSAAVPAPAVVMVAARRGARAPVAAARCPSGVSVGATAAAMDRPIRASDRPSAFGSSPQLRACKGVFRRRRFIVRHPFPACRGGGVAEVTYPWIFSSTE